MLLITPLLSTNDIVLLLRWLQLTSPSHRSSVTGTAAAALDALTFCSRRAPSRCGTSAHVSGVRACVMGGCEQVLCFPQHQLGYPANQCAVC